MVSNMAHGGRWGDLPLTIAQMRALTLLGRKPEGLSGRELAVALGTGPSAVTPLVDKLVEHGFVLRHEDPVDRRITRLILTEAGNTLLERIAGGQREHLSELLSRLTPDELEVVAQAFELIYKAACQPNTSAPEPCEAVLPGSSRNSAN